MFSGMGLLQMLSGVDHSANKSVTEIRAYVELTFFPPQELVLIGIMFYFVCFSSCFIIAFSLGCT